MNMKLVFMKLKKQIVFVTAILMAVALFSIHAYAVESPVLYVNPYGGDQGSLGTVKWCLTSEDQHHMFLPADADFAALTVYVSGADRINVGEKTILNGAQTDAFAGGGAFEVTISGKKYDVTFMKSENLPAVYINTESGSLDYIHLNQNNKEAGTIHISVEGVFQLEEGDLKQIKGRGNSTWGYPKKSYNIKFKKKTSVLGMDPAKKWALVASTEDPGFVKNPLAWYLAELTGISYTSDYRLIDLYVNGDYLGTYILCENVEVGENRIDITDLEKETEDLNNQDLKTYAACVSEEKIHGLPVRKWIDIPNDPADITGGYLLECEIEDRYMKEVSGFITENVQAVNLKAPEYASKAQVDYISSYWQAAEDALYSSTGYNDEGIHYTEYFDMESLVNMYLFEEFSADADAGITSCFFYKDRGGKLVATSVWDLDLAFGHGDERLDHYDIDRIGHDISDPDQYTANRLTYSANGESPTIFNLLFRHEDFRDMVKARWAELSALYGNAEVQTFLDETGASVKASAVMNGIRWNGTYTGKAYDEKLAEVKSFVAERVEALDRGFGPDGVQLFYDINGGSGYMYDCMIYEKGDVAVVMGTEISSKTYETVVFAPDGFRFAGWNTRADGNGRNYYPGELMVLKGDTILYARWEKVHFQSSYALFNLNNNIINRLWTNNDIRTAVQSFTKALNSCLRFFRL